MSSSAGVLAARFVCGVRARVLSHAVIILLGWPFVSVLCATQATVAHPLMYGIPWTVALIGTLGGAGTMAAELVAVGLLGVVCCVTLFSAIDAVAPSRQGRRRQFGFVAEPVLFALAGYLGVVLEYPSMLRHPLLIPLRPLTVGTVTLLLVGLLTVWALLAGAVRAGRQGASVTVLAMLAVTLAFRTLAVARVGVPRDAPAHTTVLFGVDSLSQADDVSKLERFTREHGGAWWENPVTPGLLTNVVWSAILMHRPPHETGMVFVFQSPDWSRSSYQLVRAAQARGFVTISRFSDQLSTYVGSRAGFDRDESGPVGWKQIATARLKDATIFLPVVLPHLPPIPGAGTPANQSGTFAFSVRAEVDAILTAGGGTRRSLVAAHLDYLHQGRYPAFEALSADERSRVRAAQVEAVRDLSLHWQYPSVPGEPLGIYGWKIGRVQQLIVEELERTHFLDPAKDNRLVLFSDHGNRSGMSLGNFGEPRYHKVVLAAFGIPDADPAAPISLVDLSGLLGFPDPSRPDPTAPIVEYTNVERGEWSQLLRTSSVSASGEINVEPEMLGVLGQRMRAFSPWTSGATYLPAPALLPARVAFAR